MAGNLENLNEKLDQILLDFFDKLETLEELRNDLTNAMRNGFLSMSKARYSMGNKAVGEMQYSKNMTASTLVSEGESFTSTDDKNKHKTASKSFEVLFDGDKTKSETCKDVETANESSGLRQRGAAKSDQREAKGGSSEDKIETGFASRKKSTDPLKWFGVLVPSSLRDCQKEFKTACRLSCKIAQVEDELAGIMGDYHRLKEKKRIVQSLDENKDK